MPRRNYYSYYRNKPSGGVVALNVVLIVLLSVVLILLGLYAFTYFSGYSLIPFDKFNFPWSETSTDVMSDANVILPASETDAVSEINVTETTEETGTVAIVVENQVTDTSVTEELLPKFSSNGYSEEFFANTLFIGDSIFTGLSGFGYIPAENIFAQVGLNPKSILTKEINGVTAVSKASAMQPERVCIMLGTNGLAFLSVESMAEEMKSFIGSLEEVCPETEFILLSIPPVTAAHEKDNPEKLPVIKQYNTAMEAVAEEMGCLYIDIYSMLVDSTGYFSAEYAEVDGLHFLGNTYGVVLTRIQYEITQDDSLIIQFNAASSAPVETTVSEESKYTVQIVVPDAAETTTAAPQEQSETTTTTTQVTVQIVV